MLYIPCNTNSAPPMEKKGAGTMHIKVESQILTRGAQHKSLLLQEAPGTLLKSTQGNAELGYCMPGTVSVHPRE